MKLSKKQKTSKFRLRTEEEEFVDAKTSLRILHQARKQQAELDLLGDSIGPSLAESVAFSREGRKKHRLRSGDSSDESGEEDVDEQDEKFTRKSFFRDGVKTRTLADIIMDKITEKQTEIQTQLSDNCSLKMEEVDQRVCETYEGVRDELKRYRSGRVLKAFKIIPQTTQLGTNSFYY